MVFLGVYNKFGLFLYKNGMLQDICNQFTGLFGSEMLEGYSGTDLLPDILMEYGLFNYFHNGELLINYLKTKIYHKLPKDEKEEFDMLLNSARYMLDYIKKERMNRLDTKGKPLYEYYFNAEGDKSIKIIVSSTKLEKIGKKLNMRLIRRPEYGGEKYAVVGLIFSENSFRVMPALGGLPGVKGLGNNGR